MKSKKNYKCILKFASAHITNGCSFFCNVLVQFGGCIPLAAALTFAATKAAPVVLTTSLIHSSYSFTVVIFLFYNTNFVYFLSLLQIDFLLSFVKLLTLQVGNNTFAVWVRVHENVKICFFFRNTARFHLCHHFALHFNQFGFVAIC